MKKHLSRFRNYSILVLLLTLHSCTGGDNSPDLETIIVDQVWQQLGGGYAFYADSEDGKMYEFFDETCDSTYYGDWFLDENKLYVEYVDPPFMITELFGEIASYSDQELEIILLEDTASQEEVSMIYVAFNPYGCTDENSNNYDADALCSDESCIYLGCTDEDASNYDSNATDDDGSCSPCNNQTYVTYQGYEYDIVEIGDQCWFAENCRYLPVVSPSSEGNETDPYYYVYNYQGTDVAAAQTTDNYETYGVLYNWPAVMTQGVCPSGWHIPTDLEWQTMEMALGMSASEASSTNWRGTDQGSQMKSTTGWNNGGNGTNSSGFNGLPGGYRYSGGFNYYGNYGNWWSASEADSHSWNRRLFNVVDNVYRYNYDRSYAFSCRCVRD